MGKRKPSEKKVTRYTFEETKEAGTPETGQTAILPGEEQVVTISLDNGWGAACTGSITANLDKPVVVDMDPAADPTLLWAGKRNQRTVPVLPLQKNEVVSESRIAQIIARVEQAARAKAEGRQGSLFADLEKAMREKDKSKRVGFYNHEEGWKNKLICGDSLHVIESLIHYESMRGQVQMVYMDPPYGINYDSNFQQRLDTKKNDEKDQGDDVLTIKAFRDLWQLGVHSYLTYLQERLYLIRELLAPTGMIFFQISEENVHLVRCLLDEVFGKQNSLVTIILKKKSATTPVDPVNDYLLWYSKDKTAARTKIHSLFVKRGSPIDDDKFNTLVSPTGEMRRVTDLDESDVSGLVAKGWKWARVNWPLVSQDPSERSFSFSYNGKKFKCGDNRHWTYSEEGMKRLASLGRVFDGGGESLGGVVYWDDWPYMARSNIWDDMHGEPQPIYSVQTNYKVLERCLQLSTDPGDLVFDPTCGSGTTAAMAEKWGRRWITCDTSRIAINTARKRLLSSIYPHFQTQGSSPSSGFQYEQAQKVSLKSLAYDLEPEVINLIDQPLFDKGVIRVTGPFDAMSIGRYSIEDWKGYLLAPSSNNDPGSAQLQNYIEVVSRLYRRSATTQGANGFVHAVAESDTERIAISVGPLTGRVTARQINDTVQDALSMGVLDVHVLGWAFEANVGEVKTQLEKRGKVKINLVMIRPDTLTEGLKITNASSLFSPLALPDIVVTSSKGKDAKATVTLNGVAVFDRKAKTTDYKKADSGYVSAWYLDEDYDGDCFVDCQMFFDFRKNPNLRGLGLNISTDEFKFQTTSQPFTLGSYRRIAVKVVDVFGNESTIVRELV